MKNNKEAMKDVLINLLNQIRGEEIALADYEADILIDHLIENNVVALPCKPGDDVWTLSLDKYCIMGEKKVGLIKSNNGNSSIVCLIYTNSGKRYSSPVKKLKKHLKGVNEMSRYIDEDLVNFKLKQICDKSNTSYGIQFGGRAKDFAQLTDDIPTADVAEVKCGKWADAYMSNVKYHRCTGCGEYVEDVCFGAFVYKYCPNCGARMEGGE